MTTIEVKRFRCFEEVRATGIVVVIDVIRAFSVASYAFAGGARKLWLVQTTDEAFALREKEPEAILAGEIGGRLIPGFNLNNSPSLMARSDVRDRIVIQRTGAGTRAAVGAVNASRILLAALVNAGATARRAQALMSDGVAPISLVATAPPGPEIIEDDICADYIEALVRRPGQAKTVVDAGLRRLDESGRLAIFSEEDSDFPPEDAPAVLAVDRFSFAMPAAHREWEGVRYVEAEREDVHSG